MDVTYLNIKDQWKYLYQAVDSNDQTIYFLLVVRLDVTAVLHFFRKANKYHGKPEIVTIHKSSANTETLSGFNVNLAKNETITIGQSTYLNSLVERLNDEEAICRGEIVPAGIDHTAVR